MARPVIALLTDFGTRDHYAGTMKGVALGICPDATLVDISHEVPAHDVVGGALELAAAWLAKGIDLAALGRPAGAVQHVAIPQPQIGTDRIEGQVVRVDRFGNLITNIDRKTFEKLADSPLDIRAGTHQVSRVVSTYADASPGDVFALLGSTDHLETVANGASAAAALDLGRGASVHVARRA